MPIFDITDPQSGQTLSVEGESAPTQQEALDIFQQQPKSEPTQATPDQFLTGEERLKTGFTLDPLATVEQKVAERGLASGTPLEPTPGTASLIANIKDLPLDVLDIVGPAFPALGQIAGGILAAPSGPGGIAAAGIGGAIGGETARQAIGAFLNAEEKGLGERAKRVAMEGAFGAVGEGIAAGGNLLIKATKKGIVKAGEKLLSKKGLEGFAKVFGKITRNLDEDTFGFALRSSKAGDQSVFSPKFSNKEFTTDFTDNLFFGKSNNVMSQIKALGAKREARQPIKELYKNFLGVSDDAFDMAVKHGAGLEKLGTSKSVIGAVKNINKTLPKMFDDLGKDIGKARLNLAKTAGGVDVGDVVSAANKELGDSLSSVGFLNQVADGVYEINPTAAITSQGRTQAKSFVDIITKFFSRTKGDFNDAAIKKALTEGDDAALKRLTRGKFFTSNVDETYGKFAKKLKNLDVQISGKEFDNVGQLSPQLAGYLKGVRAATEKAANEVGDTTVSALNKEFATLVDNAALLREGSKVKNVAELERVFFKYLNPKTPVEKLQQVQLNNFLKKRVGSKVFENIQAFKSLKELSGIQNTFEAASGKQNLVNLMKNAFSEGNSERMKLLINSIDPVLPKSLKPGLNAQIHTTAEALQKDTLSILKARFLSSGLGLPLAIGGISGGLVGGPIGATAGLTVGAALQNPKLLQALIQSAAKPGVALPSIAAPQLGRGTAVGGSQLLKGLLQGQQ